MYPDACFCRLAEGGVPQGAHCTVKIFFPKVHCAAEVGVLYIGPEVVVIVLLAAMRLSFLARRIDLH